MPTNKEISNVRCARRKWHQTKSLPVTWGVTMKSNLQQIPQIQQVRPRSTIAVFVAKCCHHSALWTDTCWSTPVRDLSHARFVVRHSPPMVTCTDTGVPTIFVTAVKAMVLVVVPARKWEKEKQFLSSCPLLVTKSRLQTDPGLMMSHSRPSSVPFVLNTFTASSVSRFMSCHSIPVKRSDVRIAPTPAPPTTISSFTGTCFISSLVLAQGSHHFHHRPVRLSLVDCHYWYSSSRKKLISLRWYSSHLTYLQ